MWLNMVNVKTPYLADLELESMKKMILDYKRHSQKCPRQLLRRMQQFILEEQLVICDEEVIAWDEVPELAKVYFILVMLRIHHSIGANGNDQECEKWKNLICL